MKMLLSHKGKQHLNDKLVVFLGVLYWYTKLG
jgi:hypothetical protein